MEHKFKTKNRPAGKWRSFDTGYRGHLRVEKIHKDNAEDFIYAAIDAERKKLPFGVRVLRYPDHKTDPTALHVSGHWGENMTEKRALGYIPKEIASLITQMPSGMPIAGELNAASINGRAISLHILFLIPGMKSDYWQGQENFWDLESNLSKSIVIASKDTHQKMGKRGYYKHYQQRTRNPFKGLFRSFFK